MVDHMHCDNQGRLIFIEMKLELVRQLTFPILESVSDLCQSRRFLDRRRVHFAHIVEMTAQLQKRLVNAGRCKAYTATILGIINFDALFIEAEVDRSRAIELQ